MRFWLSCFRDLICIFQKQALGTTLSPDWPFPHNASNLCTFSLVGDTYANEVEEQTARLSFTRRQRTQGRCLWCLLSTAAKWGTGSQWSTRSCQLCTCSAAHQENQRDEAWPSPIGLCKPRELEPLTVSLALSTSLWAQNLGPRPDIQSIWTGSQQTQKIRGCHKRSTRGQLWTW